MANEDNRFHPTVQNFSPSNSVVQPGSARPSSHIIMPNILLGQMNRSSTLRSHQQQLHQFPGSMAAAQPRGLPLNYTSSNQSTTWTPMASQDFQEFGYFQPAHLPNQIVGDSGFLALRPQLVGGYSAPIGFPALKEQQMMRNVPQTPNAMVPSDPSKANTDFYFSGLPTPQSGSSINVTSPRVAAPNNNELFDLGRSRLDFGVDEANERLSVFRTQLSGPCNHQTTGYPVAHHHDGLQPWTQNPTLAQSSVSQTDSSDAFGSSAFTSNLQDTFGDNQIRFVNPRDLSLQNGALDNFAPSGPSFPAHGALQNQGTINSISPGTPPTPVSGHDNSGLAMTAAVPLQSEATRRRRLNKKSRSPKLDRRSHSPGLFLNSPRNSPSPDVIENIREATPPEPALRKNGKPRTTSRRVGTLRAGSCVKCKRDKSKCVKPDGAQKCITCEKKGIACDWNVIDNRTNRANLEIFKAEVDKYKERLLNAQSIMHLLRPSQLDSVLGQNAYDLVSSWEQGPDEAMMNLKRKLPDLVQSLPALIYTPELVEAESKASGWEYDTSAKLKDKRTEKTNIEARSRIYLDGIAADIRQVIVHYKEGAHDLAEKIIASHIGPDKNGSNKDSLARMSRQQYQPIINQPPVVEQQAQMVETTVDPVDAAQVPADSFPDLDDRIFNALLHWHANSDQHGLIVDAAEAPDNSLPVEVQQPFPDIPAQTEEPAYNNKADNNFGVDALFEDDGELDALIHAGIDELQAKASEVEDIDMAENDLEIDALFEESEDDGELDALIHVEIDELQAQTAEAEDVYMAQEDKDDDELSALLRAEIDRLEAQVAEPEDVDMGENDREIDELFEESEEE